MKHEPHPSDELGAAIRAAAAEVSAPPALRARVEADRSARRAPRERRFPALHLAGAAAVGLCALVITLGIGLFGGDDRTEAATLAGATNLALSSVQGPAPAEDERDTALVRAGINGLRFPYWDDEFGLDATSARRGHLGARSAMTVVYRGKGERIGYTIVAGPALALPGDARRTHRGRLPLAVLERGGATIVTWRRAGHTCVLASHQAGAKRLLQLASWTGGGAVPGYTR